MAFPACVVLVYYMQLCGGRFNNVVRGGGWNNNDNNLRVANRNWGIPVDLWLVTGFRYAQSLDSQ
jgi:formylglycine-generating enzyme required for sulfatase activity